MSHVWKTTIGMAGLSATLQVSRIVKVRMTDLELCVTDTDSKNLVLKIIHIHILASCQFYRQIKMYRRC